MIPKQCGRPARIFSQNLGLKNLKKQWKIKQSPDFSHFSRGFSIKPVNSCTNGWEPAGSNSIVRNGCQYHQPTRTFEICRVRRVPCCQEAMLTGKRLVNTGNPGFLEPWLSEIRRRTGTTPRIFLISFQFFSGFSGRGFWKIIRAGLPHFFWPA